MISNQFQWWFQVWKNSRILLISPRATTVTREELFGTKLVQFAPAFWEPPAPDDLFDCSSWTSHFHPLVLMLWTVSKRLASKHVVKLYWQQQSIVSTPTWWLQDEDWPWHVPSHSLRHCLSSPSSSFCPRTILWTSSPPSTLALRRHFCTAMPLCQQQAVMGFTGHGPNHPHHAPCIICGEGGWLRMRPSFHNADVCSLCLGHVTLQRDCSLPARLRPVKMSTVWRSARS